MNANDYLANPSENVILAMLENNLKDYNGNEFSVKGEPKFLSDSIVGKYMEAPEKGYIYIDNPGFAVGTGDFTMDAWVYVVASYSCIATVTMKSAIGAALWIDPSNNRAFVGTGYAGKEVFIPGMKCPKNEWAHYALVRKDGKVYAFVNGVLQGSNLCNFDLTSERIAINSAYVNSLDSYYGAKNGYKAVRFCNFARWTENFDVPKVDDVVVEPEIPVSGAVPAGMVMYFTATKPPKGWLECDGSEISVKEYSNLYEVVRDTFGKPSNADTFKLPDLRGEFIRSYDSERGVDANRSFGSVQLDALQDHTHGSVVTTVARNASPLPMARVADETRPRNVALLACIKY